ncbi:MAG TPA: glycosyltransferase family 4 protein [Actinophytocola sp.]|uniref:glycosyltransferase family 4 protein n=1 Tax=Actinophytocola sp. TaxID=1872138 RepID=UPI002DDC94CB|nr:glycosyltransferase family 4 protein [Actinophytocola sp.]HEV2781202.1 glycosyltransferase family 4 protein [Actinophytocola sp.]
MRQPVPAPTFVLPGDVDDPAVISGGNVYGRRMCDHLNGRMVAVPGAWPLGDPDVLARSLAGLPDGEVVVIDGLVACGWPEIVAPSARRLRIAVVVHLPLGDEAGRAPAVAADLDLRERATLRAVGAVVVTSHWSARRVSEHHELDPGRVHVVAPGTDPAPLATGTDGRSELLCVAAVTPHKGQDLLVEALAMITDVPWACVCVGSLRRDPEFVDRVRGLIDRHGLAGRVELAGPRTGDALAGSYDAADLVVLPSVGETYGMVVADALMRGVPVLAAAVGAVPDTLGRASDGSVPGILLPERDPAAFAGALRRWLTEPDLPETLRASARDRRRALRGWDEAAVELHKVVESTWQL